MTFSKAVVLLETWITLKDKTCLKQLDDAEIWLLPGEVHVWCLDIDALCRVDLPALSIEETFRASRYRKRIDREQFMSCRGMLRLILSRYTSQAPHEIGISYGPNGKPELAGRTGYRHLRFNVSHSEELVLYALSANCEIGVDIERVRPMEDLELTANIVFSSVEKEFWDEVPDDQKSRVFYDSWVRKEAVLKAHGTGLGGDLKNVTVLARSDGCASDFGLKVDKLFGFSPRQNYQAALATRTMPMMR